jgi:nucleoside-diphosphate-sugar epimerase
MIVFVVGATGAIGRPLIKQLLAAGHEVIGTTRSTEKAEQLRAAGAVATIVDARDTDALRRAIIAASPQVVIDQLTDLSDPLHPGGFGEWLQGTVALRRDVTPALVDAARDGGALRVIAQSAAFMTAPVGPDVVDERAPLYLDAPEPLTGTITSNAAVEAVVTQARDIDGVILRYGFLYGPGTAYAPDGHVVKQVRDGAYPIVGTGAGRFPFIHVHDGAALTVLALNRGSAGIYNAVDDRPAPMREWVPYLANLVGAPRPPRVSAERAEHDEGYQAVYYGTQLRGASNAKARRELGFSPLYPDWRSGFRASLSDATPLSETTSSNP